MRKIEKQALTAWMTNRPFKSGNTEIDTANSFVRYLLHGNVIAYREFGETSFCIDACRWLTSTTKSRLNSLPGVSIVQKNYKWYLNGIEWNGAKTMIERSSLTYCGTLWKYL